MTTLQTTSTQDIFAPIEEDLDRVVEVITQLSLDEIERCPAGIDALDTIDERLAHVMATPGQKDAPCDDVARVQVVGSDAGRKGNQHGGRGRATAHSRVDTRRHG